MYIHACIYTHTLHNTYVYMCMCVPQDVAVCASDSDADIALYAAECRYRTFPAKKRHTNSGIFRNIFKRALYSPVPTPT